MEMKKGYLMLSILLVLIVFIGSVSANELECYSNSSSDELKATYEVDSSLSHSEDNPQLAIRSDEIVVNDWNELQYYCSLNDKDYTLKLKENTSFFPTNPLDSASQIVINNNVIISGGTGSYIGGDSSTINYAAIVVPKDSKVSIHLENLTFKSIKSSYRPGDFIQIESNKNHMIKNCRFENVEVSSDHASVIYITAGSSTVYNCSFINCTSVNSCISIDDSSSTRSVTAVIRNCYFEGNYASSHTGCVKNRGAHLTVYNSTFYKNSAFWWAGAIFTYNSGNTTIYDSNFTDNLAGWNGGAMYTYSWLQIYNSIFVGNNCTTNNGGGAIGACTYGSSPHIYIENCLFENNENKDWGSGRGGAISLMDDGTLEVLNSTFIKNSAKIGSAICAISAAGYGSPSVVISGNKFINHTRSGDVLNVRVSGTPANITNNLYINNSIVFSLLNLESLEVGNDKATLKITSQLSNPGYYDADLLDRTFYDIYIDGEYVKTVSQTVFDLDFGDLDICDVYAVPSIGNAKTNTVTLISSRAYIFVSKERGNDTNDGLSRDAPVNTLARAIELAKTCRNILIMDGTYNEFDLLVDYDLNIKGEGNATITGYSLDSIFEIRADYFTLKNILVEWVVANSFIKQDSGKSVEISKIIFKNNYVNTLFDVISFLNVSSSIIINNSGIVSPNLEDADLDFNWWGNTKENYDVKPNPMVNNWLFLNISADDNNLQLNEKAIVNIEYNLITKEGIISKEAIVLPKIDMIISSLNGNVSKNIASPPDKIIYALNSTDDGVMSATYNGIRSSIEFTFIRTNPIVSVNVGDVYVGSDVTVEVLLPGDATGSLTVTAGGITQIQNISSDKVIFNLSDLPANNYTLKTTYSGDNHYNSITVTNEFKVNKFKSTAKISLGPVVVGDDVVLNITVPYDATGNVTVIVNGNPETVQVNNSLAQYIIFNIARGDYIINVTYNGDGKYLKSSDSVVFDVDKLNTTFAAEVRDIIYGEDTVIRVVLNDNATGTITAKIGDKTNASEVVGGMAEIILGKVDAGANKTIYLYYGGDNEYFKQNYTLNYNVYKANLEFDLTVSDIMIGKDAVVVINTPKNIGGTFTITCIESQTVFASPFGETRYRISDLKIGEYDVSVEYNGNNYNTQIKSASFNVNEYPYPIWQNDGFDVQNTGKSNYSSDVRQGVKLIDNVSTAKNIVIDSEGNIYLIYNNSIYSYDVAGKIRWIYANNGFYGNFSGLSISRDVIIAPKAGDTLYFINQTTGLQYGHSNIYQGSSDFAPVVDENSNIYIMSEYQYDSDSYYLVIIPYDMWEYGGTPKWISLGKNKPFSSPTVIDDERIVVLSQSRLRIIDTTTSKTISSKSGNFYPVRPVVDSGKNIYAVLSQSIVAYDYNGVQLWKTPITDGAGDKLYIDNNQGLVYCVNSKGNLYKYDVFTGDEYLVSNLTVTSDILIGDDSSIYFGSENTLFALNKNGDVLWKSDVGGTIVNSLVMDNRGVIYLTTSDKLYAVSQNPLMESNMTMKINNISYGGVEIINVSLNADATGNITFKITGINYENTFIRTIEEGLVGLELEGLKCGGYTVDVYYDGDNNFIPAGLTGSFDVLKIKSGIVIEAIDGLDIIGYLKDENGSPITNVSVDCKVNDDAFSVLTDDNGRFKVAALSNCEAIFEFKNNNYESCDAGFVLKDVRPLRKATAIDVENQFTRYANDFNAGERGAMFYFVLKDGDGNILSNKSAKIGINGVIYSVVTDNDGKAGLQINLAKSTAYTYAIAYLGDDEYNASFSVSKLNLIKKPLTITPKKTSYTFKSGDKNKYVEATLSTIKNEFDGKMYLSQGKKVTLTINGKTYTAAAAKNGAIKFNIGSLTKKGTYKVTIKYAGDATYEAGTSKTITIKIS